MQIRLKPWTGNESLYFYRQSQQLSGQTGQIGKLRADFDRDGTGFFSSWEDIRPDLKTEEFKAELDNVINALRFETDGTPLGGRRKLSAFLSGQDVARLPGDEEWYGFRADTDKYSYFFRLKPKAGDYNVYVWCYKRDWLDEHLARAERGIRFIDSGYNDKFTIPDGGKIKINFPDGTSEEKTCRYIDDTHVQFGDGSGAFGLQHICEFAERLENIGAAVEPVTEPMVKLTARFYCPLKLAVYERDEYGDLEDDGYELDGRYAARHEDEIKELLKKETALSIITTSYIRSDDIVGAVNENITYLKPPIREIFQGFVGDATMISADIKDALRNLKEKIDNAIYREWCDTLIACQDDRTLKDTLLPMEYSIDDIVSDGLRSVETNGRSDKTVEHL